MAIAIGERAVVNVLEQAIATFQANLSALVPDIYGYETADNQAEITTWFQNPNNQVDVQIGYNTNPIQGMSWNVVVGDSPEVSGRRFAGNVAGQTATSQLFATTFDSAYHIGVLAVGQNLLLWSQMLCKWALLYMRPILETQYGLLNQRVGLSPLQPVPDNLKDAIGFLFMRGVTLQAQHIDTWSSLPLPSVTSASITVTPIFDTIGG